MRTCGILFVISTFMAILTCAANGGTIYVDASATGVNNGSSWGNAYIYLQDALVAAISDDNIWVAQGTYKPDHGAGVTIGDRTAEFGLKAGVALYGGFPVGGATWEQRNPDVYESILSGDLNGDDTPNFGNRNENTKIITSIRWRTGSTTLDGFTISGAYDSSTTDASYTLYNGSTGGGQMTIANCKFLDNKGRGIYLRHPDDVSPSNGYYVGTLTGSKITNCLFQNNSGICAIYMRGVSPLFKNCVFKENTCTAIYSTSFQAWPNNLVYSNPTFVNVAFIGNSASTGGGMYISGECTSLLVNCVFVGNSGGAIYATGMSGGGKTTLHNSTISGNSSDPVYGCVITGSSSGPPLELANCILWGNSGGLIRQTDRAFLKSCCIQDADPNDSDIPFGGSANNNIDDNPRFFRDPYDGGDGWGIGDNDDFGDLHLQHTSPCIDTADNASVPADTADLDGDGNITEPIPYDLDGHPRIVDGDCNSTQIVDMGAYEFAYLYLGDFAGGCDVDFADFAVLASAWLTTNGQAGWNGNCDIALPTDGIINEKDLEIFVDNWLLGK